MLGPTTSIPDGRSQHCPFLRGKLGEASNVEEVPDSELLYVRYTMLRLCDYISYIGIM